MKKQFTIFLILIFVLGLAPVNFSAAITQNQINAEVQIVCTDGAGNWSSGSGTIIDPKGIILTNKHVVEGAYKNICFIGFLESINQEPNFGSKENPNLAEVKYITNTDDMDAAVLYLDNLTNKIYPYVNIWNSSSGNLEFGDKIEVVGYPAIGGSTITYTSGDFSGYGNKNDGTQNYIKTIAPIEHGNSGGSAYSQKGEFIGIPSMVIAGSLNSIGYILSVDSIKNWLSSTLGADFKDKLITQTPNNSSINNSIVLQTDITPPSIQKLKIEFSRYVKWTNGINTFTSARTNWKSNYVVAKYNKIKFSIFNETDQNDLFGYYYYLGKDITANPIYNGKFVDFKPQNNFGWATSQEINEVFDLKDKGVYYVRVAIKDKSGNISDVYTAVYVYEDNDYQQIKSLKFYKDSQYKTSIGKYNYKIVSTDKYLGDGLWSVPSTFGGADDVLSCKTRLKNIYFESIYPGDLSVRGTYYKIDDKRQFTDIDYQKEPNYSTNNKYILSNLDKVKRTKAYFYTSHYNNSGLEYVGGVVWSPDNKPYTTVYIKPKSTNVITDNHRILNIVYDPSLKADIQCISEYDIQNSTFFMSKSYDFYNKDVKFNSLVDESFSNKLKGKIILQIESRGEAYYIYPNDGERYYMADGNEAYRVMRYLGVGITSKDLDRIKTDKTFAKKNSGKIFLQVEAKGEAYYIDFNGIAHYLKDGAAAYTIMRELGLGITNSDLNKISEGNL